MTWACPRPLRPKHRRRVRQLKLFEKATPGESVQIDVKFVKVGGARAYQDTALDDCTRLRVLRLYCQLHVRSSLDFVAEVTLTLPFAIPRIQTDHGAEFPFTFVLALERRGIRPRYIRPRCPEQKVERSHRIDYDEFRSRRAFDTFEAAATQLRAWERLYNGDRLSTWRCTAARPPRNSRPCSRPREGAMRRTGRRRICPRIKLFRWGRYVGIPPECSIRSLSMRPRSSRCTLGPSRSRS